MTNPPVWPLLLPIAGFTAYSIILKSARPDIHPLLFLAFAYATALALALCVWKFLPDLGGNTVHGKDILLAASLGLALVLIEFGILIAFRSGWPVSTSITIVNVATAAVLVVVGLLLFKERLSAVNIAGLGMCLGGLILITRK
jgi:drug/metabolite transporter (DMT)-like permease